MSKQGWTDGKGLGREEHGRRKPVMPTGKRDYSKQGLGYAEKSTSAASIESEISIFLNKIDELETAHAMTALRLSVH